MPYPRAEAGAREVAGSGAGSEATQGGARGRPPESRIKNVELARRWALPTETIRSDRHMMGLTAYTERASGTPSLVGWMLAGRGPRETSRRTGQHLNTIERDIRVVLGSWGRQAFLDALETVGIPVGFKTK